MDRRASIKTIGGLAVLAWTLPSTGQEKYPSRTIRIVVSAGPGGATDLAGRIVADVLTEKYGQPVVVENRPGAGGMVGLQYAARAPADGYTLATGGLGNHVIPPVTIRNLPIDVVEAYVPIAQVAEFVNVLVVRPESPFNDVQDLIRHAKTSGKPMSYASVGAGTSSHLTSELFALSQGIKLLHVPYKNAGDSMVDIANGSVDFGFANMPPAIPLIRGNKLKALGVTSAYRSRHLPELTTLQEQGVKDFAVSSWMGIYGQRAMPKELVHKLGEDISEGLKAQGPQSKLINAGTEPRPLAADAFAEVNRRELERWGKVAREAGISIAFGGS
jgi:tripartite-type tricarboxylate transporter receptor subunit TctC